MKKSSSSPKKLSSKQIAAHLKKLPEWSINSEETELSRTYSFNSFIGAVAFCAKVAVHAEILNHHPVLTIDYQKVHVSITTHDVGGLTLQDFELATKLNPLKVYC